jgi:hypothetical protein
MSQYDPPAIQRNVMERHVRRVTGVPLLLLA